MNTNYITFAQNLQRLMDEKGVDRKKLCNDLDLKYVTVSSWLEATKYPRITNLEKLAVYFNIPKAYLTEQWHTQFEGKLHLFDSKRTAESDISTFDNIKPVQLKRFPMLGEIACGEPIWTDEDHESYVMADMDIEADFCLRAKGDSMINARIYDGDIVFIKEMPIVNNGDIAAVIIDNEATLKRFYYDRENNYLQLIAENPQYKPLVYRNEELDEIRVLGKAVYFMSAL